MGLQVCEILSLPVLENAMVLAGKLGLRNVVESVGTIDIFEYLEDGLTYYKKNICLKGNLMLTTVLPDWPLETQCACLEFLDMVGASGLVLFSRPDRSQSIMPEFLKKADVLRFPVIQMPHMQWSYSEVINSVINAIMQKESGNFQLSYPTLMKLANASKERQNENFLLQTISKDTQVSIALFDEMFVPLYYAELSQVFDNLFLSTEFRNAIRSSAGVGQGKFREDNGQMIYYSCQRIIFYNSKVKYLVVASNTAPVSVAQQEWILEVISFFFASWNLNKTGQNSLALSILEGNQVEAYSLARALNIDLSQIKIFFLYYPTRRLSEKELDASYSFIEKYFQQMAFRTIMAKFGTGIAVFVENPRYPLNFLEFTEDFQGALSAVDDGYVLFYHTRDELVSGHFYEMVTSTLEHAQKVYPHKKAFTLWEVQFVLACVNTVRQGQDSINQSLEIIKPLMKKQSWIGELWNTLATYLLDAGCNVEVAANYLLIHPSTVKYRMNRIRELLGYGIQKVPEVYYLSTAVAILRLVNAT